MLAGRRTLLGGAIGAHRVMVACWGSARPARKSFAGEIKEWVVSETLQCLRNKEGFAEEFRNVLTLRFALKLGCRKGRRWSVSDWRWNQIVQAAREELSRSPYTLRVERRVEASSLDWTSRSASFRMCSPYTLRVECRVEASSLASRSAHGARGGS